MTDVAVHARRLRACLAVAIGWAAIVSLGLLGRAEAHRWGFLLAPPQLEALRSALVWHVGSAAALGLVLAILRNRERIGGIWSKLALACLPLLLLLSTDRIATVAYRPIVERIEMHQ
ncbi:MAG: hypothetical protein IIB60_06820, partial [Planctomycetes bacterium]|nr:hypothetical protein [Planctomycetota bacterium]